MTLDEDRYERQISALEHIASSLDVIAATLTAMLEAGTLATPCTHPADQRVDLGSTMGHARWRCKACGYEVTS